MISIFTCYHGGLNGLPMIRIDDSDIAEQGSTIKSILKLKKNFPILKYVYIEMHLRNYNDMEDNQVCVFVSALREHGFFVIGNYLVSVSANFISKLNMRIASGTKTAFDSHSMIPANEYLIQGSEFFIPNVGENKGQLILYPEELKKEFLSSIVNESRYQLGFYSKEILNEVFKEN